MDKREKKEGIRKSAILATVLSLFPVGPPIPKTPFGGTFYFLGIKSQTARILR